MLAVFIIVLILLGILFILSKNKYDRFLALIDKKAYSLKDFMPMSLYILDSVKYKFNTKYDHGLQLKLGELYEHKNSRYFLQIHWANKIALMLLMILVIAFLGTAMGNPDTSFVFFSVIALAGAFYLTDKEVEDKLKKRHLLMQIDFPDFLNKLILLVNAGMTVPKAMEKIVLERHIEDKEKDRPLYYELYTALMEIQAGKPDTKAYEDFAKRCKIPEITKFTSVIIQNIRKGNAELVSILRLQAVECWEIRKNVAKRLGEEASTKLLFPMMIMFAAILLIVVTPSVMQLQGF